MTGECDGTREGASDTATVDVRRTGEADRVTGDSIAQEIPVALVYNGLSHAVMMATPADLEDFALGFSLTEGILAHPGELYGLDVVAGEEGISINMEIFTQRWVELKQHRRNLVGRTGCGLCGTESLAQAIRPVASVVAPDLHDAAIQRALAALPCHQPLQASTGASHGAAWCSAQGEILLVREDVGRHNALDKLIGALRRRGEQLATGFVLVSSRASYEMVHKSCAVGIGALVAISAPTSLAIDRARHAGQLLVGFARPGRHVIYHRPGPAGDPERQQVQEQRG
ncbi:formate dehydrogenase accessory sulfurtransferase FdhD [Haliea sp. E1-2-M8]|uniref:formate dehydrogenase accessory sulfurtransferase FdhD n=1 Tax=Haliea sp. E1-2-M8 TaxID=3064706 RepID=UPI002720776F|nr:formate dehydrogenase accessory sulfurtransferase FdhD [Haliea sp. E1-2-M8]MDO8863803.1 formate dehydrogenase accessory sulfurtransferase FdhD [Haliea sp. E1-2-M8]